MPDPLKHLRHRERPLRSRWYRHPLPVGGSGPPPPTHDLLVTALEPPPSPDCTGDYDIIGEWDGKPLYERTDAAWQIWWSAENITWYLSPQPWAFAPAWLRDPNEESPLGEYHPLAEVTGYATASTPP